MVRLLLLSFQQSLQTFYLPILRHLWFIVLLYLLVKKLFILCCCFKGIPLSCTGNGMANAPDHFEHKRKKEACEVDKRSAFAQKVTFFFFAYITSLWSLIHSINQWIWIDEINRSNCFEVRLLVALLLIFLCIDGCVCFVVMVDVLYVQCLFVVWFFRRLVLKGRCLQRSVMRRRHWWRTRKCIVG